MFIGNARDFAAIARSQREQLGMSQADLAEAVGRTQAWVSAFETSRNTPRLDSALLVARALGLGFDCTDDPWAQR